MKPVRVSRQRRMLASERLRLNTGQLRAVDQRGLDVAQAALVVAGKVQAQVIVIDRWKLEVRERTGRRDRGPHPDQLEVRRPPPDGEEQAVRSPREGVLELRNGASSRRAYSGVGRPITSNSSSRSWLGAIVLPY